MTVPALTHIVIMNLGLGISLVRTWILSSDDSKLRKTMYFCPLLMHRASWAFDEQHGRSVVYCRRTRNFTLSPPAGVFCRKDWCNEIMPWDTFPCDDDLVQIVHFSFCIFQITDQALMGLADKLTLIHVNLKNCPAISPSTCQYFQMIQPYCYLER